MPPYLQNLRRRPRVPLRLRADILHRGESWRAETEDLGPGGCLISTPRPLVLGAQLRLVLRCDGVPEVLDVPASVAWARDALGGVVFTPRQLALSNRPEAWFQLVLARHPGLAGGIAHTPGRLALDAPLYVVPAPRHIPHLSPDELAVLRVVLDGTTVQGLLSATRLAEGRGARALFALLEKGLVTLSMGQAGEAWKWRAGLAADYGPAPAGGPTPALPPSAAPRPAAPTERRLSPQGAAKFEAGARAIDTTLLRGVTAARRSPEAQARLEEARAASDAGRIDQAVALLRQALALSPRDAEISTLLGQLAFKDRKLV